LLGYSIACFSRNKPARKKRFCPRGIRGPDFL
jgi:hypothetical protein